MIPPDVPPEAIATGPPSAPTSAVAPPSPPPAPTALPSTPLNWRLAIGIAIGVVGGAAYLLQPVMGPRGQALAGVFCFFGLVAAFSANLRAVNWHTIGWGIALQVALALLVLKVGWVYQGFEWAGEGVKQFIHFSYEGGRCFFVNLPDA